MTHIEQLAQEYFEKCLRDKTILANSDSYLEGIKKGIELAAQHAQLVVECGGVFKRHQDYSITNGWYTDYITVDKESILELLTQPADDTH